MSAHNLPTMKKYWFSCKDFTIYVGCDGLDYINETAPIAKKFIGQPLGNLEKWMTKIGDFKKSSLK